MGRAMTGGGAWDVAQNQIIQNQTVEVQKIELPFLFPMFSPCLWPLRPHAWHLVGVQKMAA